MKTLAAQFFSSRHQQEANHRKAQITENKRRHIDTGRKTISVPLSDAPVRKESLENLASFDPSAFRHVCRFHRVGRFYRLGFVSNNNVGLPKIVNFKIFIKVLNLLQREDAAVERIHENLRGYHIVRQYPPVKEVGRTLVDQGKGRTAKLSERLKRYWIDGVWGKRVTPIGVDARSTSLMSLFFSDSPFSFWFGRRIRVLKY
mmetsp:Transcript_13893/g.27728  ORF Transcript_13893/g.27728 Transcript_13893/m.27728 type:complete len:202 (-) Transcript_13893:409-1014(-)